MATSDLIARFIMEALDDSLDAFLDESRELEEQPGREPDAVAADAAEPVRRRA